MYSCEASIYTVLVVGLQFCSIYATGSLEVSMFAVLLAVWEASIYSNITGKLSELYTRQALLQAGFESCV